MNNIFSFPVWFGYVDTTLMLFIAFVCVLHLNRTALPWYGFRNVGFSIVGGASVGLALRFWLATDYPWLVPALILLLHAGIAVIAAAVLVGRAHTIFDEPLTSGDLLGMAMRARTEDDLKQLRSVAMETLIRTTRAKTEEDFAEMRDWIMGSHPKGLPKGEAK